jgi:C_GCAxxG_C_C family probable redox protein
MISIGEKKFNCCESTLMKINEGFNIPGFGTPIIRAASNMGGGVSGWGSVCGAVSGAAMALGLIFGTNGDEELEVYKEKREKMRALTQEYFKDFEDNWGTVGCIDLLGVDFRTPEGKERYEAMKESGETFCEKYVEWSVEKILEILERRENL